MKRGTQDAHRARGGFTLIELLIVVVIIGILAAIGAAQYQGARERAYEVTVRSDMQSLIKHQELHYLANDTYGTLGAMTQYQPSTAVSVAINYSDVDGWSGTATHDALTAFQCGVYVGQAPAAGGSPATVPERLTCTGD